MKFLSLTTSILLALTICTTTIFGQDPPPPTAPPAAPSAPVLKDDDIRLRSVELERIRRQNESKGAVADGLVKGDLEARYPEIKEDFEGIQISQNAVVNAYTMGESPNYAAISENAGKVNEHARRLYGNLFPLEDDEDEKEEKEEKPAPTVRDFIIDLDNSIGALATSKMFQNLRVIDSDVAKKTRADLAKIIEVSASLSAAAGEKN